MKLKRRHMQIMNSMFPISFWTIWLFLRDNTWYNDLLLLLCPTNPYDPQMCYIE